MPLGAARRSMSSPDGILTNAQRSGYCFALFTIDSLVSARLTSNEVDLKSREQGTFLAHALRIAQD